MGWLGWLSGGRAGQVDQAPFGTFMFVTNGPRACTSQVAYYICCICIIWVLMDADAIVFVLSGRAQNTVFVLSGRVLGAHGRVLVLSGTPNKAGLLKTLCL